MTQTPTAKLMTPEEIAVRAGEQTPFLHLPQAGVFAERALRLKQLASEHPMRDFLLFAAELAQSQHEQLKHMPTLTLPDGDALEAAARAGQAALPATLWRRDPAWRAALGQMLASVAARTGPGQAREVIEQLRTANADWLEQQADRLLNGVMRGLDLAAAPLIAAGLQLYWVSLVQQVQATHAAQRVAPFGRTDDPTRCPCCASLPVASVTRLGAEASGFRYLSCSLCAAEWHYVRIKCTHCQSTKGISLQSLVQSDSAQDETATASAADEGKLAANAAVQAECCGECGHYLKIVHMEKDQQVEPHADDLATLTLDLLLADSGLQRHGVNLMLLFGESPDDSAAPSPAAPTPPQAGVH